MARAAGWVLVAMLIAAVSPALSIPAGSEPVRELDCAAVVTAGAVECVLRESWIATSVFPATVRTPWPPAGFTLKNRALLASTESQPFCVIPIRTLIRDRDALYGEPNDLLPRLHEGFDECAPNDILQPQDSTYQAIVHHLRTLLPRPQLVIQPDGNTIVGMWTTVSELDRPLRLDVVTEVALRDGVVSAKVTADGMMYVQWDDNGVMTGPYTAFDGLGPQFMYRQSGMANIHMIDVWTVHVALDGAKPFYDVVYLGYPSVTVRVNELVIRVNRGQMGNASEGMGLN